LALSASLPMDRVIAADAVYLPRWPREQISNPPTRAPAAPRFFD